MTMTGTMREVAGAVSGLRFRRSGAGLVLAVLLLAGCPGTSVTPETETLAAGRPTMTPPLPRVKPARPQGGASVAAKAPSVPQPPAATATPASVDPASLEPVPTGPVSAEPAPVAPASAGAVAAGAVAAAPAAKPSIPPNPDTLVGLDQIQTRRLLGAPAATEEAPPAKVWRYAKGDCTLKVFFFMDMTSSQDFRALSYDMKSSENVPDVDSRCFAQLLAQAWDVHHD